MKCHLYYFESIYDLAVIMLAWVYVCVCVCILIIYSEVDSIFGAKFNGFIIILQYSF